jgi:hypothetical protein
VTSEFKKESEAWTVSWAVVRYDDPPPSQDPWFRGGPQLLAVPGDTLRVSTPDGVLEGEPHREVFASTTAFLLLTGDHLFYVDHEHVEDLCLESMTWTP